MWDEVWYGFQYKYIQSISDKLSLEKTGNGNNKVIVKTAVKDVKYKGK
jgi:hypothetical protein